MCLRMFIDEQVHKIHEYCKTHQYERSIVYVIHFGYIKINFNELYLKSFAGRLISLTCAKKICLILKRVI